MTKVINCYVKVAALRKRLCVRFSYLLHLSKTFRVHLHSTYIWEKHFIANIYIPYVYMWSTAATTTSTVWLIIQLAGVSSYLASDTLQDCPRSMTQLTRNVFLINKRSQMKQSYKFIFDLNIAKTFYANICKLSLWCYASCHMKNNNSYKNRKKEAWEKIWQIRQMWQIYITIKLLSSYKINIAFGTKFKKQKDEQF